MRTLLRSLRARFHRIPTGNAPPRARKYTIYFTVGGAQFYMIWDAWERDDDGQWVLLTPEQIGRAFEYWIADGGFTQVSRGGPHVGGIRGEQIEAYEVVDNSYFEYDL